MKSKGQRCLHIGEPDNFEDAKTEECWRRAMNEELWSIQDNNTWELADLPNGQNAIELKWVYKVKKDAERNLMKHKARLVAKACVQEQDVDFEEVFAPVARMDSVRLLIALAAQESWRIHHLYVNSAFLTGELEEELYVKQPPGYIQEGEEHKVLKLHKALYGLRQAPRAWNVELDRTLISLGFEKAPLEHAMYKRGDGKDRLLVGIYVDDLLITGADEEVIANFKLQMKKLFKMTDLGLLSYYLGIEVQQKPEGIIICQEAYAKKVLESCGMKDCNPSHVPMKPRLRLSKKSEAPAVDATEYRSVVRKLRYLTNTRPDLAYSVGIVSRFMEAPTTEHWAAVENILRYIKGTTNFGCVYLRKKKKEMVELLGYSDSDMAGDVDDRKSTSGVAYFLGGSIVSWLSQKQKVVALSSREAEYIAAATAVCQGVCLGRLLGDLTGKEPERVVLNIDDESTISLWENQMHHGRCKHIDTRYRYIRECVEESKIDVNYICTDDQLADILTRSLGRQKFVKMRRRISVQAVK
uniref:Reverse transcriptase Ty1/copia-type domain-containing protein n=1 Tax=Aegilops tauschii subsp. strangulata TaxID=200361 RepID=A0A453AK77_AEGTS